MVRFRGIEGEGGGGIRYECRAGGYVRTESRKPIDMQAAEAEQAQESHPFDTYQSVLTYYRSGTNVFYIVII